MVRSVSQAYEETASSLEGEEHLIWTVEILVPEEEPVRIRLTQEPGGLYYGTDSQGAGVRYHTFPFKHGGVKVSKEGSLPTLEISVSNVTNEFRSIIHRYRGFDGMPVTLRLLASNALTPAGGSIEWSGEVAGCAVEENGLAFSIASRSLVDRKTPSRRYTALRCRVHRFGDGDCQYPIDDPAASFSSCPRTMVACIRRGLDELLMGREKKHPERFDAERGLYRGLQ